MAPALIVRTTSAGRGAHAPENAPGSRSPDRPRAIITGFDSGIGRATAVALAEQGMDVGITWHQDEEGATGTAEECRATGARAEVRRLDLDDLPAAADVVDELAEALGGVDVLVNNAGDGHSEPFLDHDLEAWRHVLRVDLEGAFLCGQRAKERSAIPWRRPGDAREIASVIAFIASPGAGYLTGTSVVVDGGMLLMAAEANRRADE